MKIISINTALVLLLFFGLAGCKKSELISFSTERNLFFEIKDTKDPDDPSFDATVNTDSLGLSFALLPDEQNETEIKIPIKLIGPQLDQPLPYSLVVNKDVSDLVEGVDYKWKTEFVFPAGKSVDTIRIQLLRKEKMQAKTFKLSFQIKANEHFAANMLTSTDRYRSTAVRCFVNDIMGPPKDYVSTSDKQGADYFLGAFSKKKLQITTIAFNEAYGESLTESMVYGYMVVYADMFGEELYSYLLTQKELGNTIYEVDGTEMTAGEYFQ